MVTKQKDRTKLERVGISALYAPARFLRSVPAQMAVPESQRPIVGDEQYVANAHRRQPSCYVAHPHQLLREYHGVEKQRIELGSELRRDKQRCKYERCDEFWKERYCSHHQRRGDYDGQPDEYDSARSDVDATN